MATPEPPKYIQQNGQWVVSPTWVAWNAERVYGSAYERPQNAGVQTPNQSYAYNPPGPKPTQLSDKQQGGYSATFPTTFDPAAAASDNQSVAVRQMPNGLYYNVNKYGVAIGSPVAAPQVATTNKSSSSGLALPPGYGSGPTWYEQQQIALDKQRIKDAEAAQAAQEAYQHQQQLIAESNAVEAANQAFRDAQLKSTYGTINGMAYGAPKGSPFAQLLPEPSLIKQGYKDTHQPDPWSQAAPYGGYTGSSYMNAQQPGLSNAGDLNQQTPKTGPGSAIPIPSMAGGGEVPGGLGQPQLIMAHGGEEITPAPGTPLPTLMGSPGGAPFSNPLNPSDPNNPSPQGGGSLNDAIANLIQAAQALVTRPDFKAPIPAGEPSGQSPVPGMAAGGTVPYLNSYGQSVASNVVHPPSDSDVLAGPGRLNHLPYSPALTGLSGFGGTMTPNGTPVVMSNWQRQHLMPSSISGPGGYDDYAMQVAGWSPQDLQQLGTDMTGNFGTDLSAPKNYAPIAVQPAPSGG